MQITSAQSRRRARIEIIPLIDIMFFLLATFIMVSLSMIKNLGVPVNLPSAFSAKSNDGKPSASVSVSKEGKLFWNKEEMILGALPAKLRDLLATDPDPKISIHGDKESNFGLVVSVLDVARKAGVKHTALRTLGGGK